MAMPRKLKFLNTFLDGVSYLGVNLYRAGGEKCRCQY